MSRCVTAGNQTCAKKARWCRLHVCACTVCVRPGVSSAGTLFCVPSLHVPTLQFDMFLLPLLSSNVIKSAHISHI